MLNAIDNSSVYPVATYLDDVFATVWKPLGDNEWKAKMRRQLQRSYVQSLTALLCPTDADLKGNGPRNYNSDAALCALQQLAKAERFCQQQKEAAGEGSLNALHYDDLLREMKLIRERRVKP